MKPAGNRPFSFVPNVPFRILVKAAAAVLLVPSLGWAEPSHSSPEVIPAPPPQLPGGIRPVPVFADEGRPSADAEPDRFRGSEMWRFEGCRMFDGSGYIDAHNSRLVKVKREKGTKEKPSFLVGAFERFGSEIEADRKFGSAPRRFVPGASRKANGAVAWDHAEGPDAAITRYLELPGDPVRQVFVIQHPGEPRSTFSGNPADRGPGTYTEITLFDNYGNYLELGTETDNSTPPQRIYQVHSYCRKAGGDLFGFTPSPVLMNMDDPVVTTLLPEVPTRMTGPEFLPLKRSALDDPSAREKYLREMQKYADALKAQVTAELQGTGSKYLDSCACPGETCADSIMPFPSVTRCSFVPKPP